MVLFDRKVPFSITLLFALLSHSILTNKLTDFNQCYDKTNYL